MGDFQPISLSNSIELIIEKVLVNRFREVIGELVGPFQSDFIPGMQLVDGKIVASEILVMWKRRPEGL